MLERHLIHSTWSSTLQVPGVCPTKPGDNWRLTQPPYPGFVAWDCTQSALLTLYGVYLFWPSVRCVSVLAFCFDDCAEVFHIVCLANQFSLHERYYLPKFCWRKSWKKTWVLEMHSVELDCLYSSVLSYAAMKCKVPFEINLMWYIPYSRLSWQGEIWQKQPFIFLWGKIDEYQAYPILKLFQRKLPDRNLLVNLNFSSNPLTFSSSKHSVKRYVIRGCPYYQRF